MTAAALPLRLVAAPEPQGEPAGLVLPPPAARDLLARLGDRLPSYARLRLALAHDAAILFAPEPAPLPWSAAAEAWLGWDGALLVPFGQHFDVPARWRAEVVRRLLERHGLAGPAALLPGGRDGRLRLFGLAGSRALADLDARDVARLAA